MKKFILAVLMVATGYGVALQINLPGTSVAACGEENGCRKGDQIKR